VAEPKGIFRSHILRCVQRRCIVLRISGNEGIELDGI
jgi:hypothetical protein